MNKSLSSRIVLSTSALIFVVVGVLAVSFLLLLEQKIAIIEEGKAAAAENAFFVALDAKAREAQAAAESLAANDDVRRALAARDRDAALKLLSPSFEMLKKNAGFSQMHFIDADMRSFLRVMLPEKHGDDLSSSRPMLAQANAGRTRARGLEGGVVGLAVRGMVPVTAPDGRYLGILEAGSFLTDASLQTLPRTGVEFEVLAAENGGFSRLAASSPDVPQIDAAAAGRAMAGERFLAWREGR
ncbi:MAG TPA: cache domain-containing protein [Azospirillaceae bacterium]|nr:cache domain-containing protein [Azospirillaceae bacterium]HRQ81856.1 cache domain-containing protein [Azospirillaceae bacterium]